MKAIPDLLADVTLVDAGAVVLTLIILTAGGGLIVRKYSAPVVKLAKKIDQFLEEWNGEPDELDAHGDLKTPGRPGISARLLQLEGTVTDLAAALTAAQIVLERVRAQVQNGHPTNLRDDVDELIEQVGELAKKLDQHISIAKDHDRGQAALAAEVKRMVSQVDSVSSRLGD